MKYNVCYTRDASNLKGEVERVIFPETIEELQEIVKNSKNIIPRGFGISQTGACIPNNSLVVDMRKMNKIKFNRKNNTVIAEAGISIKELNEKLKPFQYEFPVYSSDKSIRTIGGAIALNCNGERSMKYGLTSNWIEEIEMINGRGELIKLGKVDMPDIIGTEGTTGIIVKAILKLAPIVKRSASIFQSNDFEEVLTIAKRLKLDKEIIRIKFLPKNLSKLLGFPEKYHLIIEFNSQRGKIKEKYEILMKKNSNDLKALYSQEYCDSFGVKLFYSTIREFITFLEKNQIPYIGNLGIDTIYPFFKKNEKEKINKTLKFLNKFKLTFSGGYGLKRKNWLTESEKKIFERIKKRYDPFNKMNKGKIIDIEKDRDSEKLKSIKEIPKKEPKKEESFEKPIETPLKKQNEKIDYNSIQDIMTNKFKKSENEN